MHNKTVNDFAVLDDAYRTAINLDVSPLCVAVERWIQSHMLMVGSGGSYSVAMFAADLHERYSGNFARAATPLELISKPIREGGVACFSARGQNHDIVSAFRVAALNEVDPLTALVLADQSRIEKVGATFRYADVISVSRPSFSDGYLAVASMLGSAALLIRAYRNVLHKHSQPLPSALPELFDEILGSSDPIPVFNKANDVLNGRHFLNVIYSPELKAAATDIESRFVECALCPVQISDFRNFGHGRHFWLSQKGKETGVLALISDVQETLGTKTISLLPDSVDVLPIRFSGAPELQALVGLIVSVVFAEIAAKLAQVNTNKPGVRTFGRQLYRLKPNTPKKSQFSLNRDASLQRKRAPLDNHLWHDHYESAIKTINSARFSALTLDYDGTLCDTRDRTKGLQPNMAAELMRLAHEGAIIGFATGRGPSAGIELRTVLPRKLHDQVMIGYYNGAVVLPLSDDRDPIIARSDSPSELASALAQESVFRGKIRENTVQISIDLRVGIQIGDCFDVIRELIRKYDTPAKLVTSGHAIDICKVHQTKLSVLHALKEKFRLGDAPILRIGDRGKPMGNDWELLDDTYGLSVDEVSQHPSHCWSLSPAGLKGTQATEHYLRRLRWTASGGRMRLSPNSRA